MWIAKTAEAYQFIQERQASTALQMKARRPVVGSFSTTI